MILNKWQGQLNDEIDGLYNEIRITEIPDDPTHRKIVEMHRSGASLSEICRAVFGAKNGRYSQRIKDILKRYGEAC